MKSESRKSINDMLRLAQTVKGISVTENDFDTNPYLINLLNGTYDLRNDVLLLHDPRDMISKLAPVEYGLTSQLDDALRAHFSSGG